MNAPAVRVEHDGPVTIVTIDRPEVRNAVDRPTAALLADAFRAFDADDSSAVAILTGRGVSGDEALGMGLANRLTEPGGALDAARVLAHELAALPPRCLREDRLSSYEQWGASLDEAMRIELRHARATLASGEALEGAIRFTEGAGRHGAPA